MDQPELYGGLSVYRSRGAYLECLEQFQKSIDSYNEAAKQTGNKPDFDTLIGRSRSQLKAFQYEGALRDANLAEAANSENVLPIYLKAQAYIGANEFEKALILFYRGSWRRKCPKYFLEGIGQASETIEDCIGINSGNVMIKYLPTILEMEKKNRDPGLFERPRDTITAKKQTPAQRQKIEVIYRKMVQKYLGRMAADVFFLKNLVNDPRLMSGNTKGSEELIQSVKKAHLMTEKQFENLRARRPYYTILLAEKNDSVNLNQRQKEMKCIMQRVCIGDAKKMISACIVAAKRKDTKLCLDLAERARHYIYTKKHLPGKTNFLTNLFLIIGEAIFDQKRINPKFKTYETEKRIDFLFGMPLSRPPSRDSVYNKAPHYFTHGSSKGIKEYESRLADSNLVIERVYLLYELSRLYCDSDKSSLSIFYSSYFSKKCVTEAVDGGFFQWAVNASFMSVRNCMQVNNRHDAKIALHETMQHAKMVKNNKIILLFLDKCNEVISQQIGNEKPTQTNVERRENQILKLMTDSKMKLETEYLFRKMAHVPLQRKFTIMPGAQKPETPADNGNAANKKTSTTHHPKKSKLKISLRPAKPEGYQNFDLI